MTAEWAAMGDDVAAAASKKKKPEPLKEPP